MELNLQDQQAATLDALENYVPVWSSHRTRWQRTEGLDALLNEQWRIISGHMDSMLERYFTLIGGVELEPILEGEPVNVGRME